MANLKALHHAGESIAFFLQHTYEASGQKPDCEFVQFPTGKLPDQTPATPTIGLTLYRVEWNEHLRHAGGNGRRRPPLALNLHYLVTSWADSAPAEQVPFAWTLLQLHQFPLFDRSMLRGDAGWSATDKLELVPLDLTHEEIARVWDKLASPYRLSTVYCARVLQIEPVVTETQFLPVVATRNQYVERVPRNNE